VADRVTGRVADRLVVPFAGEGSGTGNLSWGQQTIWRGIEARDKPIWLTGVAPLPEGATVDDVAAVLSYLMSRYQSLRTRFRRGEDGQLQQVVAESGEIWLDIIDADDEVDPFVFSKEVVEEQYDQSDRDYATDWPLRMAVVRHRGVATHRVMAMCHTTTDGFGILAMLADLEVFDPRAGAPIAPVTSMEALEQARVQGSPTGQRQSRAAERHWEKVLATMPARRFPGSREKCEPRYWMAIFNSPVSYLAMQLVAARTGVDTSPVLLAAFAVSLARVSGINPAVPRVMVNNRFRPRLGDTLSPITQTCPCVIDVAGATFDETVFRAWRSSLAASKNAYFEPARIRALLAAADEKRGEPVDVELVYNDRRMVMPREAGSSLPGPEDLRAALPRSTFVWEEKSDNPLDTFHLHIRDEPETMNLLVAFDTHYVSPADTEALLRGMETVLVKAAFDPNMPVGI
jgi:hypothetical protein